MKKILLLFALALIAFCGMRGEQRQTLVLHKDSIVLPNSRPVKPDVIGNDWVYKIDKSINVDSLMLGEDVNPNKNSGSFTIYVSNDTIGPLKCKSAIGPNPKFQGFKVGTKDTVRVKWLTKSDSIMWVFVGGTEKKDTTNNAVVNAEPVVTEGDNPSPLKWIVLVLLVLFILGGLCFWFLKNRKDNKKTEAKEKEIINKNPENVKETIEEPEMIDSLNDLSGREYAFDYIKITKIGIGFTDSSTKEEIRLKKARNEYEYNEKGDKILIKLGNLRKIKQISLPFTFFVRFVDKNGDAIQQYCYPYVPNIKQEETKEKDESINEPDPTAVIVQQPTITLTKLAGWLNVEESTEEGIQNEISNIRNRNQDLENLVEAIGSRLGIDLSGRKDLLTIDKNELARAIDSQKQSEVRKIWNEVNGNVTSFLYKIQQIISQGPAPGGETPKPSISSFEDIRPFITGKFIGDFKNYIKQYLLEKGILKNQGFSNRTLDDLIKALLEQEEKIKGIGLPQEISSEKKQEIEDEVIEQLVKNLNDKIVESDKKVTRNNILERCSIAVNAPSSASEIERKAEELAADRVKAAEIAQSKAEGQVDMLKDQLKEAEEKAINAKETYIQNVENLKEQHKAALQEQETLLIQEKDTLEAKMTKEKEDLEVKLKEEKDVLEAKLNNEKEELQTKLTKEKDAIQELLDTEKDIHHQDLQKLHNYLEEYIKGIRTTFNLVSESLMQANKGNDAMMKKIISDIVDNRTYSLDYFDEKLQGVLKDAESAETMKSVEEVKAALSVVFEDCLKEDDPTWLDVLVRFYSYTQVRFLSDKLADLGIDVSRVVTAFQSTVVLLHQFGIEINYPKLFVDNYDSERHDQKQVLNILSYLPGIENDIREQIGDNEKLIVDLRTVGYCVNGEVKEKPVVAKFY